MGFDMIVTVFPNHLFRQIGIVLYVFAIGRNRHADLVAPQFRDEPEPFKNLSNRFRRNRDSQHAVDFGNGRVYYFFGQSRAEIIAIACDRTAMQRFDQVQCAIHRDFARISVNSLLKTCGGIGGLPQFTGSLSDVVTRKFRRFQNDFFRTLLDLAV